MNLRLDDMTTTVRFYHFSILSLQQAFLASATMSKEVYDAALGGAKKEGIRRISSHL